MPTTKFSLTATEYTDLGTAPCFLQSFNTEPVLFVLSDTKPAVGADAFQFSGRTGNSGENVLLTGRVWARASSGTATVTVGR